MVTIISASDAANLSFEKNEIKKTIVEFLNEKITERAKKNLHFFFFMPLLLIKRELQSGEVGWLLDLLRNEGYTVRETENGVLAIYW